MERSDDIQIAIFKEFNRKYRVSKYRETRCGKGRSARTVYFLNKICFPSQTRIRIRITCETASSLAGLSNLAGMKLCEELITEQLSRDYQGAKAKGDPSPDQQEILQEVSSGLAGKITE
jgi:hypothetical protein